MAAQRGGDASGLRVSAAGAEHSQPAGSVLAAGVRTLLLPGACLGTVRYFVPADGEMSEQFDQHTGAPRSARHLAWSYASFISCVSARSAVLGAAGARRHAAR